MWWAKINAIFEFIISKFARDTCLHQRGKKWLACDFTENQELGKVSNSKGKMK